MLQQQLTSCRIIIQHYIGSTLMIKTELKEKYDSSNSFKKEMDKSEANYQVLLQRTIYSNLSDSDIRFIKRYQGENRLGADIFFIDGTEQHDKARSLEKLSMAFIRKIPKPKSKYVLVYLNNEDESSSFSDFKTVMEIMPMDYYMNIVRIILFKPSFLQKAGRFFVFGTIPKFLNAHIQAIDQFPQLCDKLVMDAKQVRKYVSQLMDHKFESGSKKTEQADQINLKVPPAIDHHNKQHNQKHQQRKFQINQYDLNQNGLPELFQALVFYFQTHPERLDEVGIFRKSASIDQQMEASQKMAKKHYGCLQQIYNPHIVANLIKRFLGDLQTPIIPFDIFEELMEIQNVTAEILAKKMKQLGQINMTKLVTLMFLLQFLIKSVIPRSAVNKMTAQNIAICFAPCLMWAKQRSLKDLVYATKSVYVVSIMVKNFEEVFGSRKQQDKVYRESYMKQRNKSLEKLQISSQNQDNPPQSGKHQKQQEPPLVINKTQSKVMSDDQDDSPDTRYTAPHQQNVSQKINQTRPKKQLSPYNNRNVNQEKVDHYLQKPPLQRRSSRRGIFTSKIQKQGVQLQQKQKEEAVISQANMGVSPK